jgi:ABC-type multidrug transport system fused ATPase/permease subunit
MVFIVILIASFLLQLILPWWVIVIVSFVVCGLIGKTGKIALWSPFIAILLLWTGMALFKSYPNHHILAMRVAEMVGVKAWWLILALTSIVGGFVAAVSGFCGYHFRKAVLVKKATS